LEIKFVVVMVRRYITNNFILSEHIFNAF